MLGKVNPIMKKNPFSIYDFLGYVFPGAFAILLIYVLHNTEEIRGCWSLVETVKSIKFSNVVNNFIVLTLLSYILGYLISYLSSLSVEQFSI